MPTFGVALPPGPDGKQLVAFSLTLPMGWCESPPYFCAVTETVADLANKTLEEGELIVESYRLNDVADSPAPVYLAATPDLPMRHN